MAVSIEEWTVARKPRNHDEEKARDRITELEVVVRAALSFVQERHADHNDGHAQMVIMALRGALAKRERD